MLNILHRKIRTSPRRSVVRASHRIELATCADLIAGVLGATGSVGQRFILLLALHPHFVLHAVGASERSAGKKYKDAVKWKQAIPFTERIGDLVVKKCTAEEFKDCDLIFSGLDSDVAGDVGTQGYTRKRTGVANLA
jgi:aspartate-semialdehyde dehydrogenase